MSEELTQGAAAVADTPVADAEIVEATADAGEAATPTETVTPGQTTADVHGDVLSL